MSVVSVVRTDSGIENAVRKALRLIGGIKQFLSPGSKVILKPNLWKVAKSGTGLITDVRVVGEVARLCLKAGARDVTIAEGSAAGYESPPFNNDTLAAFEESGLTELAQRMDLRLVDLNRDEQITLEVKDFHVMSTVKVARTIAEADVIINLPVMKTHPNSGVSLSLKNMKGALPGRQKSRTHRLGLEPAIADLNMVIRSHLVVVDAIRGMEGMWEYPEDSVTMNLIIAGADQVAVDATSARIMGLNPKELLHLCLASQKGLGTLESDSIEVKGVAIENVIRRFRPAAEAFFARYPNVNVVRDRACTGCENALANALYFIKASGFLDQMAGLTLAIGYVKDVSPSEKIVAVGQCACDLCCYTRFIKGCPPSVDSVIAGIARVCNIDEDKVFAHQAKIFKKAGGIR